VKRAGAVAALALAASLAAAAPAAAPAPAAAAVRALPKPAPCPGCWVPAPVTSWQWQLQGKIDRSVDAEMFDVDLFDTPARVVRALHREGRHVVCYLDAGTWERWRPDASTFPSKVLGRPNGWPGERWLDVRRLHVLAPIMQARIALCARRGFDGVEFDNVDGYANHTGFPLTAQDQLRSDTWLANQAHRKGLSVALKNDLGQVRALLPYFDWALDEQCFQYHECGKLKPFTSAGKAVMEVEYRLRTAKFCPKANRLGFNALAKHLALGPWRVACR
jgi:hypothetical protein